MPIVINLFITSGVLGILLVVFNESGRFKYIQQEALIIVSLVSFSGLLVFLLVPSPFDWLAIIVQPLVLFYCVERISQMSRRTSLRVSIWYFGIMALIGLGFAGLPG